MKNYRNIIIIHKKDYPEAKATAFNVAEWLYKQKICADVMEAGGDIPESNTDCVVVTGGDGTILGVSRKLATSGIPIFGINFGKVGFLTIADIDNWQEKLVDALSGNIPIRRYLALEWTIIRKGKEFLGGLAANDVVITRCFPARLVCANIIIEGHKCGLLRSDGIIVCTPLGSTGYSISAGGPLLYAPMDAICLTPICPFPTGIAPLVFPGDSIFELELIPSSTACFITIDGQDGLRVEDGDVIKLRGLKNSLSFFSSEQSFFKHLQKRGFSLENLPGE